MVNAGAARGSGHNLMNDPSPSLPIEPLHPETSEEHQKRMDAKRERARYFGGLDKAALAPSTKASVQDTRARAVTAYREGEGVKAVATRFGIAPATLQTWLTDAGVPLRDASKAATAARARTTTTPVPAPSPAPPAASAAARPTPQAPRPTARPQHRTPTPDEQARLKAVTAYVAGDTVAEIATRLSTSQTRVRRWLEAAGVERRPAGRRPVVVDVAELAVDYAAGATLGELGARVGLNAASMARRFKAAGITVRTGGAAQRRANPAPGLPAAAPSAPAPLSSPPLAEPDDAPAAPTEVPAPALGDAAAERDRLRDALARTPASTPDQVDAIAAVRAAVETVLTATDELRERWTDLQIARDFDAGAAFGRIRVSAEHVLALATRPDLERTA